MYVPRGQLVLMAAAVVAAALITNANALSKSGTIASPVLAAIKDKPLNNTSSEIPTVKLVYKNQTYEMLPFVIVDQDGVKKLNFPRLADEYKPVAQIPSDAPFGFEFAIKPREVNAFGIDYDADTTEVNPLTKIGKYQYSFGKLSGILTLEVRAIYDNGKYVTYTGLVKINNPINGLSNLGRPFNPISNHSGIPDIFS